MSERATRRPKKLQPHARNAQSVESTVIIV
jgi:hypothetical protein